MASTTDGSHFDVNKTDPVTSLNGNIYDNLTEMPMSQRVNNQTAPLNIAENGLSPVQMKTLSLNTKTGVVLSHRAISSQGRRPRRNVTAALNRTLSP